MKKLLLVFLISFIFLEVSPFFVNECRDICINTTFDYVFTREKILCYPASASVTELNTSEKIKIGIALDTNQLNFGKLYINYSSGKYITLENNYRKPMYIRIFACGNISDFLEYPPALVLKPKERKNIKILFNATEIGNFTGYLLIKILSFRFF